MKYKGRKDKAAQAAMSGARKVTTWETKMQPPPLWYEDDIAAKIELGKIRIARIQLITAVRDALTAPKYEFPAKYVERHEWLSDLRGQAQSFYFDSPDMAAESFPSDLLNDLEAT